MTLTTICVTCKILKEKLSVNKSEIRIFCVFYQWKITEDGWNIWIGCGSNSKVDCLPTTRSQSLVPPVHVSRYPWGSYKSPRSISDCVNVEKSGSSMVVTTVASQQERPWVQISPDAFLWKFVCSPRICVGSLCLFWFPPTPPKTCMGLG